jgi:PAS domain S-box-containing protein
MAEAATNGRILIVEDDGIIAARLQSILTGLGYTVAAVVASGEEAIERAAETRPGLVLMDVRLAGAMDGIEAGGQIRARWNIPVVYLTAHMDDNLLQRAMLTEPYGYLVKPVQDRELRATIEMALYKHRMEWQLRESEVRLQTIADFTYDWEYWVGVDGRYLFVSPSCERITGYRADEFTQNPGLLETIVHPDDRPIVGRHLDERFESDEATTLDFRILTRAGEERWISHVCTPVYAADGRPLGRRASNRDITGRKRAESQREAALSQREAALEALRRRERDFSTLVENAADMIVRFDANLRHVYCNPAVERQLGIPVQTFLGKTSLEVSGQREQAQFIDRSLRKALETGQELQVEQSYPTPSGVKHFQTRIVPEFDPDGHIESLLAITRDITGRVQAESQREAALSQREAALEALRRSMEQLTATQAQLIQAAKLAAVGELAAGVAHELNNPLTSILGFAELLLNSLLPDGSFRHDLEIIAKQARRARDIVRNLLDFARQTRPQRLPADVNSLLCQTLDLVRQHLENNGVVIEEDYAPDLGLLTLDAGQMKQVFLNLITNASHAMPEGGKLTLRTNRLGDEVVIAISDTGEGMPLEVREHIFEPFFTTKPTGEGTGLGLSISLGIVQEHGGRIAVESQVGQGSTFTVWLPIGCVGTDHSR